MRAGWLLLCILGLALSVHVYPSLKGAVDRVDAWHEMERRLFEVQRTREGFEIEGVDPDLVGPSADSGLGWLRKAPPGGQPTGRTSAGSRLHG